ncbi:polyprenyl synthetase family protein [Candidatus Riflebacteria bacterium]
MIHAPIAPDTLRQLAIDSEKLAAAEKVIPPVTLDELKQMAAELIKQRPAYKDLENWVIIMLNNALWQNIVAGVPFKRRMLLLPQCLKNSRVCRAKMDEFGLLCEGCGGCVLHELLQEAEQLGIMCLVAEGSTLVADLIESGNVDAVIGVSCFDALEKAFPYMVKHAVPGMALPLFTDGCKDTFTDIPFLRKIFNYQEGQPLPQQNLKQLYNEVKSWFVAEQLEELMGKCMSRPDAIAREWLLKDGKRYRPFLLTATAECLGNRNNNDISLKKLSLAVECFHKASLIHDDIEDNDSLRYEQPSLHVEVGVPVALNTGDLLLGEGYRLLSEVELPAVTKAELLQTAASGHLQLCRGQGDELLYLKEQQQISLDEILHIFRQKTAPAFEVALQFGAIFMDAAAAERAVLREYSRYLGIAYQIRDDLNDSMEDRDSNSLSILNVMQKEWGCADNFVIEKVHRIYAANRQKAFMALQPLRNFGLKKMLFQITTRILKDVT